MAKSGAAAVSRLTWRRSFRKYWMLYCMLIPGVLWYLLFKYLPMGGIVIAFQKYPPFSGLQGIFNSKWVGLKNFEKFFKSVYAARLIRNSLVISLKKLVVCFPASIILAILLNAIPGVRYKKTIQTVSYLPHFLSTVAASYSSGSMPVMAARYTMEFQPIVFHNSVTTSTLWK